MKKFKVLIICACALICVLIGTFIYDSCFVVDKAMLIPLPSQDAPAVSRIVNVRKVVEADKKTVIINEVSYSGDLFSVNYTVKGFNKDVNVKVYDDNGKEHILVRNNIKSGVWLKNQVDGYDIALAKSKYVVIKVNDEEVKVEL